MCNNPECECENCTCDPCECSEDNPCGCNQKGTMSRNEMKDWIVMMLAGGTIVLLFVITLGDFYNAIQTNRPPDKDVINLLSMAITGIVGIIAGFISGKNAADQAKQQAEAQGLQK